MKFYFEFLKYVHLTLQLIKTKLKKVNPCLL